MSSESSWGAFTAERADEYLVTYGTPSVESREIVRDVLAHAAKGRELSILDLGCGNGALYTFLAESGLNARYTGVDFSEPLLDAARARHPGVVFIRDDVESLNAVQGPFDVVLYSHVLETLESPQASLRRAAALAPRCVIRFFEPPGHDVDRAELRKMDVGDRIVPYIRRSMSRDYYRLLLADIGCESVDVYRCESSRDQVHVLRLPWPRS